MLEFVSFFIVCQYQQGSGGQKLQQGHNSYQLENLLLLTVRGHGKVSDTFNSLIKYYRSG